MTALVRKFAAYGSITICIGEIFAQQAGGTPPARPDVEDTYTITSTIELAPPFAVSDMNDDFQEAKLITQDKNSAKISITYFPLFQQKVSANPSWRTDYSKMIEYLRPTPVENWDDQMRNDLINLLKSDGIDPDVLTDKEVVEKVSTWAFKRSQYTNHFGVWAVHFREGQPEILPRLLEAFNDQKPNKDWTPKQTFEEELLGRSMFYNKVHGSCTSSSIYISTILRAIGIPTRIVFAIPPFDPNDPSQGELFYNGVHHHLVRETVRAALTEERGFSNHLFNEVFVGNQWVRLNYKTLGQPILDRNYFGLLTHILTTSDLSQVPLAETWGVRYFLKSGWEPKMSSHNPYRLVAIKDHFGDHARIENPMVPPAEFRTVTIDGLYQANSSKLPEYFRQTPRNPKVDLYITFKERVDALHPMRTFYRRAGHDFVLTAPNEPTVRAHWEGLSVSSNNIETIALVIDEADRGKFNPKIAYSIQAKNTNSTYVWIVLPGVSLEQM